MLPDVSKFLPGDKIYEDLLRPSAQSLGSAFGNVVKTARFLLAPFDYLAAQQDRFQNFLKRISEKVPTENLTEASPEIVGNAFEAMRYLDDSSILTEMFVSLLAVAVDKERNRFAHPAFPKIISNLCRDEAIIIYFLSKRLYTLVQYASFNAENNTFSQNIVRENTFPLHCLDFSDNFFVYMNHLNSLGLAGVWQRGNQEAVFEAGRQVGTIITSDIMLTEFGMMLSRACVIDDITQFGVADG